MKIQIELERDLFYACLNRIGLEVAQSIDYYLWDEFTDNTSCFAMQMVLEQEIGDKS